MSVATEEIDLLSCTGCGQDDVSCELHGARPMQHHAELLCQQYLASRPQLAAHSRGVAQQAASLISDHNVLPRTKDMVVALGLVHDLGYVARRTGFPPVDSARALEGTALEMLGDYVAWHSFTAREAFHRGISIPWPRPVGIVPEILWIANYTTSVTGLPVTPAARVQSEMKRHKCDSPRGKALSYMFPEFLAVLEKYGVPYGGPLPTFSVGGGFRWPPFLD